LASRAAIRIFFGLVELLADVFHVRMFQRRMQEIFQLSDLAYRLHIGFSQLHAFCAAVERTLGWRTHLIERTSTTAAMLTTVLNQRSAPSGPTRVPRILQTSMPAAFVVPIQKPEHRQNNNRGCQH
jgi:hypothetical protein